MEDAWSSAGQWSAMTEPLLTIHEAMAAARRQMKAVDKGSTNEQQGWSYRSAEALISSVGPALASYGVNVSVAYKTVRRRLIKYSNNREGEEVTVRCWLQFTGPNGDTLESTGYGVAQSAGSTAIASAQTMAFKQLLGQALCVPFTDGDVTDPDANSNADEYVDADPEKQRRKPTAQQLAARKRDNHPTVRQRALTAAAEAKQLLNVPNELPAYRRRATAIGWVPELWSQVVAYINSTAPTHLSDVLVWMMNEDEAGRLTIWGSEDALPVVVDVNTDERLELNAEGRWVPMANQDKLETFSLPKLRNAANDLNLPTDGTREQLIARIKSAGDNA